jgi:hypothetical protein
MDSIIHFPVILLLAHSSEELVNGVFVVVALPCEEVSDVVSLKLRHKSNAVIATVGKDESVERKL